MPLGKRIRRNAFGGFCLYIYIYINAKDVTLPLTHWALWFLELVGATPFQACLGLETHAGDRPPKRGELEVFVHAEGASNPATAIPSRQPSDTLLLPETSRSVSCLYLFHTGMARFLFFDEA